jgi:oligoendopeptidase F
LSDIVIRERCDWHAVYPGGVASSAFRRDLDWIRSELAACEPTLAAPALTADELTALVRQMEPVGLMLTQVEFFSQLIVLLDSRDPVGRAAAGEVKSLEAWHGALLSLLDKHLIALTDAEMARLSTAPGMEVTGPALLQRRRTASERLPAEQEKVIRALAADGMAGWADVYQTISGRTVITLEQNGETERLPLGSARAQMARHPDRERRAQIAKAIIAARESEAPLLAAALNHIAGYRTTVYKLRGWHSVLQEPLANHRMREESLEAMWTAVDANWEPLHRYIRYKAKELGGESIAFHDLFFTGGGRTPAWPELAQQVADAFADFDPDMANFARTAFAQGLVDFSEGEGRSGVNQALPLPVSRTYRVLMSRRAADVLGHELGHAYSYTQMWDTPPMTKWLPVAFTLMEVPSTFAQVLVAKHGLQRAAEPEERRQQLADSCARVVQSLTWARTYFEFERAFYERRMQGPLTVNQICDTYVSCAERAYGTTVTEINPYGWVAGPLMSANDWPFYNFPYTVADLLAAALYARWQREGQHLGVQYKAVMRDTALLSVEAWAEKHLGADLSQPESWQAAINLALEELRVFLQSVGE